MEQWKYHGKLGFSGVMEEVNLQGERIWMLETPIQEKFGFFGTTTISFEN